LHRRFLAVVSRPCGIDGTTRRVREIDKCGAARPDAAIIARAEPKKKGRRMAGPGSMR